MDELKQLLQLINDSEDEDLKTKAAALIQKAQTGVTGLEGEKEALLRKRDELLGKLTKFKKFEAHADVDIDGLLQIKSLYESQDSDLKTKYESLYNADKKKLEDRVIAIEEERKQEKAERETEQKQLVLERTKAAAIAEFSKPEYGIFSPEQLYRLVGDRIRLDDSGKPITGDEYKTLPLSDFVKELRENSDYQNQFKASNASGSGSLPGQGNSGGNGSVNPWKRETFNLTQQGKIARENPQLAASMKAAAGVK